MMFTVAFLEVIKSSTLWLIGFSAIFVASGLLSIRLAFNRATFLKLLKAEVSENRLEAFHLLTAPFIFIGTFALICAQLNDLFPGFFVWNGLNVSPRDWIAFALDQTFSAIFFDALEAYKVRLSGIDYVRGFWISSLIFAFKIILEIVFWKFIINFFIGWKPAVSFPKR